MSLKICSLTIWFNPGEQEKINIESYRKDVECIIIVDNSEKENYKLIQHLNNVIYISNKENLGIATALNMGCKKAIELGFDWILTMDQDSSFKTVFKDYRNKAEKMINLSNEIGLFAAKTSENEEHGYVDSVITSGNLVRLKAFNQVEGFDESFFIDEVDHDFCNRLRKKGYKIYKFEDVILNHKIGNSRIIRIFGKEIIVLNHNYIRKYYISRNRFYMSKRYPEYSKDYMKQNLIDFIKIILGEKDKIRKIKYMIKGYLDFKKNMKGKIYEK